MKTRLAVALVVLVILSAMPVYAVRPGDQISIEGDRGTPSFCPNSYNQTDRWDWVKVENPCDINTDDRTYCGEEVVLGNQGMVTVLKIEGTKVRCRYTTLLSACGTSAPNGTEFYVNRTEFERHLKIYQQLVRENGGWAFEYERQKQITAEIVDNIHRESERFKGDYSLPYVPVVKSKDFKVYTLTGEKVELNTCPLCGSKNIIEPYTGSSYSSHDDMTKHGIEAAGAAASAATSNTSTDTDLTNPAP